MLRREKREQAKRDASILARGSVDTLRTMMGDFGNREAWRGYFLRYPSARLVGIREALGLTQAEAADAAQVSMREWKCAEEGGYSDGAWRLLGVVAAEDGGYRDPKSWADRFSAFAAEEARVATIENRKWRRVLRSLRKMLGWSIAETEKTLGFENLIPAEYRMPDNSDLLGYRLAILSHAYIRAGYLLQLEYQIEQEKASVTGWSRGRLRWGGDLYATSGLFGISPAQWIRFERGLFWTEDERVLADGALVALGDSVGALGGLATARDRHSEISQRMRAYREESPTATYDGAVARLAEEQGTRNGASLRKMRQRRNLRAAAHSWAILENGCAPCTSEPSGLKSVALFFMSGADWPHYYKKHLRFR